ncbi:MAG: hypothetical protein Q4P18_07820 [Methanobrevibacter sp.]|uniref:hypothetical protein n=1 Tax=Methanobrevibacter sp. TaxID=66852 RepID=UPI0026DF9015|nr:hypothetical protein [Methanobrevibacter sp.]MDO5849427.1 hypothetical protein [Methanobrevibacter sp.]
MNNKQLIVIVIAIIAAGCIVAGAIYFSNSNSEPTNMTIANNTTNITENESGEIDKTVESTSNKQNSQDDAVEWAHKNQIDGKSRYQSDRADESIRQTQNDPSHGGPGSGHCPACDPYA